MLGPTTQAIFPKTSAATYQLVATDIMLVSTSAVTQGSKCWLTLQDESAHKSRRFNVFHAKKRLTGN
jgi:hypothetical protein